MPLDFDNLIRDARPTVPALARERVLDYALTGEKEAGGAAASTSASLRLLARVAALVVLALVSGIAAAVVALPDSNKKALPDSNEKTAERPGLASLRLRVEYLEAQSPAARLASLEQQVTELESDRDIAMRNLVLEVADARETQRMEEWRERHIQHVRDHTKREADATIERLRKDVNLSAEQEAEVRALLDQAGKEAESLIGNYYGRGRHSTHSAFEKLAQATDEKLNALLSEQQREKVGAGLVSDKPEDWGPSSEFRDGTDYEVYMNWMSVSRE